MQSTSISFIGEGGGGVITTLFQLPRCLDRIHIESFLLEI